MAMSSGFGVKAGEGRIGARGIQRDKPCGCPSCTAHRFHMLHEIEADNAERAKREGRIVPPLPEQNAPSTFELQ